LLLVVFDLDVGGFGQGGELLHQPDGRRAEEERPVSREAGVRLEFYRPGGHFPQETA
jgi:hypothetical protein